MHTAAQQQQNGGQNGKFDPSTWAGQARQLARNEADAMALLWGLGLLALAAAVCGVAVLAGLPAERLLSVDLVLVALGLLAAVALIWVWSYAQALRTDTQQVRVATWQREMALGVDLDGDGAVGRPQQEALEPAGHVVKVGGQKPVEIVMPDLETARDARPLIHFPVPANDVIFFLRRAEQEGVTFRPWDKQRLPCGREVDRALWGALLDGLMAWQFATATVDSRGRRLVSLRTDVPVDAMIHAVRSGAGVTVDVEAA